MKKKMLLLCMSMLLLAFLLLNPSEAAAGSRSGLLLWFQSVLPVLLPFFILSRLLIALDGLAPLLSLFHPAIRTLFGLSPMGCYALLLGVLCGYPMGAKTVADLVRDNAITREEGDYLLLFCNNVSPAFLLGFCLTEHLKAPQLVLTTTALVYGLPLLLALFWRKGRTFSRPSVKKEKQASRFQISFKIMDTCIMDGLESIWKLGCYIILFSIMTRLAALLPWPHALLCAVCTGVLEITNGIAAVSQLQVPFLFRYLCVLGFVIFGGLSGVAQTDSMLQGSGLSTTAYVKAKLITTCLALVLAAALFMIHPKLFLLHGV